MFLGVLLLIAGWSLTLPEFRQRRVLPVLGGLLVLAAMYVIVQWR